MLGHVADILFDVFRDVPGHLHCLELHWMTMSEHAEPAKPTLQLHCSSTSLAGMLVLLCSIMPVPSSG